jgi:hypothetical protein
VAGILKTPAVKKRLREGKEWRELWNGVTGRPRLDELRLYLEVYDMWRSKVRDRKPGDPGGWYQIINHFAPDQNGEEVDRQVKRYKEKAARIIGNVERGVFPGPY